MKSIVTIIWLQRKHCSFHIKPTTFLRNNTSTPQYHVCFNYNKRNSLKLKVLIFKNFLSEIKYKFNLMFAMRRKM